MTYDPRRHHRRSIRMKWYDYSQEGAYFVTMTMHNRRCALGKIIDGRMIHSEAGKIVDRSWKEIQRQFRNIGTDEFVVMPNHIHGILIIQRRGLINQTPTDNSTTSSSNNRESRLFLMTTPEITLGKIVRYFKARTARLVRTAADPDFRWQRNYYEHIIRDADELARVRVYIRNNVLQWYYDMENRASSSKLTGAVRETTGIGLFRGPFGYPTGDSSAFWQEKRSEDACATQRRGGVT